MSCMMLSVASLCSIADALETIGNAGYNYCGFECPQTLFDALATCRNRHGELLASRIYQALWALNDRAYCARYKDARPCPFAPDAVKVPHLLRPVQHSRIGDYFVATIQPGVYQLLKHLDCLLYELDEGDTMKDPLFIGLDDLRSTLCGFIARNATDYINTPWG